MATVLRLFLVLLSGALGCAPELPVPGRSRRDAQAEIEISPPAELAAAPRVLWARVRLRGFSEIDESSFAFVRGHTSQAHQRQLARGEISKALAARTVPARIWRDDDEEAPAVIVAPAAVLEPGETYSLLGGRPEVAFELVVQPLDPWIVLPRIWPPEGASADAESGIWCGEVALPVPAEAPLALAPDGPAGVLRSGFDGGAGARCLRFESTSELAELERAAPARWVPPPVAEGELALRHLLLDPRFFVADLPAPPEVVPLACEAAEQTLGPGCARVQDDRIVLRTPEAPLLWAFGGPGLDVVTASDGAPIVIAPFPPDSALTLSVTTIDLAGRRTVVEVAVHTLPPMPHLVLNEALANPLGAEPDQEWVELVNDGTVPANLAGFELVDSGGRTVLPPAVVAPGQYVLLVNEAYTLGDEFDVAPPSDTPLVRVDKLGKNGLSNGGEPLRLEDPSGLVISRLPPKPKPKAGESLCRVQPGAPDGAATSFLVCAEPTPGAPNRP